MDSLGGMGMGNPLLMQIRERRQQLKLKQQDMYMRVGISRQQYHRIEAKGNPRLDTLELIAEGLNAQLVLVPKEHIEAVKSLLASVQLSDKSGESATDDESALIDNPWQDLL